MCCMFQETQAGALFQSRGMGWGGRWEEGSKGRGYMYTYGWFMLRFDRKQQNSVKQLSSNLKINKFFKKFEKENGNNMEKMLWYKIYSVIHITETLGNIIFSLIFLFSNVHAIHGVAKSQTRLSNWTKTRMFRNWVITQRTHIPVCWG